MYDFTNPNAPAPLVRSIYFYQPDELAVKCGNVPHTRCVVLTEFGYADVAYGSYLADTAAIQIAQDKAIEYARQFNQSKGEE